MKIWRYYFPCANIKWGSEITYPWMNVLIQTNLSWFKRDMKEETQLIAKLYISFIHTCPYQISDNGCSILYLFSHMRMCNIIPRRYQSRILNKVIMFKVINDPFLNFSVRDYFDFCWSTSILCTTFILPDVTAAKLQRRLSNMIVYWWPTTPTTTPTTPTPPRPPPPPPQRFNRLIQGRTEK